MSHHEPRIEDSLMTRRQALCRAGMGFGSLALGTLMAESGVESVRLLFPWSVMQADRGVAPDFSRTDRTVAAAAARVRIVIPATYGATR